MDALKVLESSSLFSSLNKRILWRIASLAQEKSFQPGEYLVREGEKGDFCYIISSGLVEIFRDFGLSEKFHINHAGAGEIIGELAIIDGLPRSANVQAIELTQTLAISEWDFKAQLQAYPEIALQLIPVIARRLRQTQNQLAGLTSQ